MYDIRHKTLRAGFENSFKIFPKSFLVILDRVPQTTFILKAPHSLDSKFHILNSAKFVLPNWINYMEINSAKLVLPNWVNYMEWNPFNTKKYYKE